MNFNKMMMMTCRFGRFVGLGCGGKAKKFLVGGARCEVRALSYVPLAY
jgi:hypothetical protein